MTGYTWREVRSWAEEYTGDASGQVTRLLREALDGSTLAWEELAKLYQAAEGWTGRIERPR